MRDASHADSPCISVCVMDPAGVYCTGCYRTLTEIASWTEYSASERRAVLERLAARRLVVQTPQVI